MLSHHLTYSYPLPMSSYGSSFCVYVLISSSSKATGLRPTQMISFQLNSFFNTPILWPPDAKNWLIKKRPWCWERLKAGEEGATEDEMFGWHHQRDGHKFEQALRVSDGQKAWCAAVHGSRKESDTTEQLNWTELNWWRTCLYLWDANVFFSGLLRNPYLSVLSF